MCAIWKKVSEELPVPGMRVKIDGKHVRDAMSKGFPRAIFTGVMKNGLPGFTGPDTLATIGVTDWLEVNMDYEDEKDWEWAKDLAIPPVNAGQAQAHVI